MKRPTIAFVCDSLNDDYSNTCWNSIVRECRSRGFNVICFPGGAINHPYPGYNKRNQIFKLINSENTDGIISLSGALINYTSPKESFEFFRRYDGIPIVSLGVCLKGIPSLTVDNFSGMYDLVTHFIEVHHYKRIAFIKGPDGIPDADERFAAYKQAIEDHGMILDQDLVIPGNFTREKGQEGARILLARKNISPDAIVAANDYMALYAGKECLSRGLKIPADIALGGFDNLSEHIADIPTMTTVEQPLRDLCIETVEIMAKLLNGNPVSEHKTFPSRLVIRESCGCFSFDLFVSPIPGVLPEKNQQNDSIGSQIESALICAIPLLPGWTGNPLWIRKFITEVIRMVKDKATEENLRFIKETVYEIFRGGITCEELYGFISLLFEKIEMFHQGNLTDSYKTMSDIYRMIGLQSELYYLQMNQNAREQDMLFNYHKLFVSTEEGHLFELLKGALKRMAIPRVLLGLYQKSADQAKVIFGYDDFGVYVYEPGTLFPAPQLFPGGIKRELPAPVAFVVIPLIMDEREGFVILDAFGIPDGLVFEKIFTEFNNKIKMTSLLQALKEHSENLEAIVEDRTRQLEEAQDQLLTAAHRAGMADVAVGVIHNAGNLLNSINLKIRSLSDILTKSKLIGLVKANGLLSKMFKQTQSGNPPMKDPKILTDYYHTIYDVLKAEQMDVKDKLDGLILNMEQIIEFIHSQQKYTESKFLDVLVNLPGFLDSFLESHKEHLGKKGVMIVRDYSREKDIILKLQRYKLAEALDKIVKNAIEAMDGREDRQLTFSIIKNSKDIILKIRDNGIGIPEENLTRIFQFGFSSKEGHSGFSLHQCANYLYEMGGELFAKSEGPGRGASFFIKWSAYPASRS